MSKSLTESAKCTPGGFVAFTSGIVMGTASTITIKLIYEMQAVDSTGHLEKFEKPLFTTLIMFLGMAFSLIVYYVMDTCFTPKEDRVAVSRRIIWMLIVPAIFDLIASALSQASLLYVSVSVYQLLRCTVIIVTAMLKAFVLREKLTTYMWAGVGINTLAMLVVSSTTFIGQNRSIGDRDPKFGIALILLSCIIQGSQYVLEEKFMVVDNAPPLVVIGMEGVWGVLIMLLVIFPISYYTPGRDDGSLENPFNSLAMIANSSSVQLLLFIFFLVVAGYNIFAIYVTHLLSSIWHAILDNFRPISVWSTDLIIYYYITHHKYGEAWLNDSSWIQFVGMLLLFIGTAVYNGSFPMVDYSSAYQSINDDDEDDDDATRTAIANKTKGSTIVIRTPSHMASPALMRSPMISRSINQPTMTVASKKKKAGGIEGHFQGGK